MIFQLFLLFFIIAFVIVLGVANFAANLIRFLLNPFRSKQPQSFSQQHSNQEPTEETVYTQRNGHKNKIIEEDEGEYVEFEEIKDK